MISTQSAKDTIKRMVEGDLDSSAETVRKKTVQKSLLYRQSESYI
jgi:hypothetical protein